MNDKANVLPADFDGVFRFTNFTTEDFVAKWDNIEYTFPAKKMTPMVIPNASPEQVQNIRKKFARELAIREFYNSPKFKALNKHTPGGTPALYNDSDLAPFSQRCLEPLPIGSAKSRILPKQNEQDFLSKNKVGKPVTRILDENESLIEKGSAAIE